MKIQLLAALALAVCPSLIVERVRAGMRRARLEGRHIGRRPLDIDRAAVLRHRMYGHSLGEIARTFRISKTTVRRVLDDEKKHTAQLPEEKTAEGDRRLAA